MDEITAVAHEWHANEPVDGASLDLDVGSHYYVMLLKEEKGDGLDFKHAPVENREEESIEDLYGGLDCTDR